MRSTQLHPLDALTHLDGRNAQKVASLRPFFSERAWMQYRYRVIVGYLALLVKKNLVKGDIGKLKPILSYSLTIADGERIHDFEKTINHDLRSLELFVKNLLSAKKMSDIAPFVNLGIGSEDINNVALRLLLKDAWHDVLKKEIVMLMKTLCTLTETHSDTAMLARTHGQIASVTTFGKEIAVYLERMTRQMQYIDDIKFIPKFSGEVGNFNSLVFIFPKTDWNKLQTEFLADMGFDSPSLATQIPPYDDIVEFFDALRRLNTILIDLAQDMWIYGSLGYVGFTNTKQEAGSSGMPHKINPQYFEGARGGLETSNALSEFFGRKLMVNHLQREFSDSTVRRNVSTMYGLSMLSYQSLIVAFDRTALNTDQLFSELDKHWEVCSETLHTVLKAAKYNNAYELVKNRLKGKTISRDDWVNVISELNLTEEDTIRLSNLTPDALTGISEFLAKKTVVSTKKYLNTFIK